MKPCCHTLKFLGRSHIEGYVLGQCTECGSIRHGAQTNWRIRSRNGEAVMVAVKDRVERKGAPARTRPTQGLAITVAPGMTIEELIIQLKQKGVVV